MPTPSVGASVKIEKYTASWTLNPKQAPGENAARQPPGMLPLFSKLEEGRWER